jgi:hypothetical protein
MNTSIARSNQSCVISRFDIRYSVLVSVFAPVLASIAACGSTSADAKAPTATRPESIVCADGPVHRAIDEALPPMYEHSQVLTGNYPLEHPELEPGCILPFRDTPSEQTLSNVRVVVSVQPLNGGKRAVVGKGFASVGRDYFTMKVHNDAGDNTMTIELQDQRAHAWFAGKDYYYPATNGDSNRAQLPLDVLVFSLQSCANEQVISRDAAGNIVHAKSRDRELFRTRWMPSTNDLAVDSVWACRTSDTEFFWRSTAGLHQHMLSLASAQADTILTIAEQDAERTEDLYDPSATP